MAGIGACSGISCQLFSIPVLGACAGDLVYIGSVTIKLECVIIPCMLRSCMMKYLVSVFLCAFVVQGVSAQSEDDLLDQLRANYAALLDARAEFESAEKNGSINNAEQADYAAWIQQLSDQFTEDCRTLSAHPTQLIPADIPCTEFTSAYFSPVSIDTEHERTDAERTAAMVGQFNDSLGEFDEKLLREQDRVKSQKPRVESAASGAGGDAGGESGEEAGGESGAEPGGDSEGDSQDEGRQEDRQGDESAAGTDQSRTGAPGSSSRGSRSNAPDDIPDGSDDDVIARQLREAAEKEADPELQKKLWEEYRRYKTG